MKGDQQQLKKAATQLGEDLRDQKTRIMKDTMKRATQKGMTPKDVMGLTDAMVEGIYGQAYRLYNTGKFLDASRLFRLLIMLNATEPKYVMGLAACFHMLKEYKNAVDTYTILGVVDPDSPVSFYHASDCFIQMGDPISAITVLEMAVKRAGDKPEYVTLKDRARMTIDSLNKEISQGLK